MKPVANQPAIVVVQTCVPDYRLDFFRTLAGMVPEAAVTAGADFFTGDIVTKAASERWYRPLKNRFLCWRNFLWQSGVWAETREAGVVIAEFNPRVLSTWVLLLGRRLQGKRTLLWGHAWGRRGAKSLTRPIRLLMGRLSHGIICYSQSQAKEISIALPRTPVWAAPNSCVLRAECESAPTAEPAAQIVFVGRLIRAKKPRLLLEAFARIAAQIPADTKLVFVGQGSEGAELRQRVQELGLAGRVEFLGHVRNPARLRAIYDRAAVAVSPGYVGLSAIQSMAFGVPMVVSRDEEHSPEIEACIEGKTCTFFRTDSEASLAAALRPFVLANSPWRQRRAAIARFVADNYTIEGMVAAFATAVQPERAGDEVAGREAAKVAIVWAQFGPYHLARLRVAGRVLGTERLLGIELANLSTTYAWQRDGDAPSSLITLCPGMAVEKVGAVMVYRRAVAVFRRHRIGVVFVPSYWPASSLAILLAAKRVGARCVMMNESHAGTAKARGILRLIKHRLVRVFDAGLLGGTPQLRYFSSLGMPADKLFSAYDVVDNAFFGQGADLARADEQRQRADFGLPARFFLSVGRMEPKKNLRQLVEAYVLARRGYPPETMPALVLVGSGLLEPALRKQCLEQGLLVAECHEKRPGDGRVIQGADVYFYGFRQVNELPVFYGLAEAFVLPSREEEWGLVVNEAMASGCAVLVSSTAGCCEDLVAPGENGWSFDPANVAELAGQLGRFVADPALARRMGEKSARRIGAWGTETFAENARRAVEAALAP